LFSFSRADAQVKQSPEAALLARDVYEEVSKNLNKRLGKEVLLLKLVWF